MGLSMIGMARVRVRVKERVRVRGKGSGSLPTSYLPPTHPSIQARSSLRSRGGYSFGTAEQRQSAEANYKKNAYMGR